eukprot:TRINITY_DN7153_c0_g1_i1.p1 TRINITY_DN7153_c0_g1~~TRINITY_DN7153_c0_g1_i1.p1  ORF type:complete len:1179 (+),score=319.32 TRINITY_DN7153_c0_g1_i1:96-3632(+)
MARIPAQSPRTPSSSVGSAPRISPSDSGLVQRESTHAEATGDLRRLRSLYNAKMAQLTEMRAAVGALERETVQICMSVVTAEETQGRNSVAALEEKARVMLDTVAPHRVEKWRQYGARRMATLPSGRTFDDYVGLAAHPTHHDEQISKDMPRTFGGIKLTCLGTSTDNMEGTLRMMVRTWVARSEDEGCRDGYVQGMNVLCAIPCMVMKGCSLSDVFGVCVGALEDVSLPETFAAWPMLGGLIATQQLLADELKERIPRLEAALGGRTAVEKFLGLALPRWLMMLWGTSLPGPVLLRLWDEIIAELTAGLPSGDGETPRRHSQGAVLVPWRWALGLFVHLENEICEAAESASEEEGLDPEVKAYLALASGLESLPVDFRPPDTGPWDQQDVRRRHSLKMQALKTVAEPKRLSMAVTVSEANLRALRAEFEMLRGSVLDTRRHASVQVRPQDEVSLGMIFAPESPVVIAVEHGRGFPPLTGWQLRAVGGAALSPEADLSKPWVEWPVLRWEWESDRLCDGYEAFGAADARMLEESWASGRGKLTTRGLSFNQKDRILYTYDFASMEERQHDSSRVRKIRRIECRAGEQWEKGSGLTLIFEADGVVAVYQHQCFRSGWGLPPKGQPAWTDPGGQPVDTDQMEPPGMCKWDGAWRVDRSAGGGVDGWLYATGFADHYQEDETDAVRRRRWVRRYVSTMAPRELDVEEPLMENTSEGTDLEGLAVVMTRVCPEYPIAFLPNLFRLLDVRQTGRIDFYALAVGTSLLGRGTVDAKLRLLHNLYDTDADEMVNREEARRLTMRLREVAHARRVVGKGGAVAESCNAEFSELGQSRRRSSDELSNSGRSRADGAEMRKKSADDLIRRRSRDDTGQPASQHPDGSLDLLRRGSTGTPRAGVRRPVPLPPGAHVVIQGGEDWGDHIRVWWVHKRVLEDFVALELKSGIVKEVDTHPLSTADDPEETQQDVDSFFNSLFARTSSATCSVDTWAEAARQEAWCWRALIEAGIPLGQGAGRGIESDQAAGAAASPTAPGWFPGTPLSGKSRGYDRALCISPGTMVSMRSRGSFSPRLSAASRVVLVGAPEASRQRLSVEEELYLDGSRRASTTSMSMRADASSFEASRRASQGFTGRQPAPLDPTALEDERRRRKSVPVVATADTPEPALRRGYTFSTAGSSRLQRKRSR